MATKKKMLQAAAGSATGGAGLDITDVFSTYLYEGTGAAQTITNGIDLDGEGGLVWLKTRSNSYDNWLYDTVRGNTVRLISNSTAAQGSTGANGITSFNSDGFGLGAPFGEINGSGSTYASWTFRKAPKFFDVVQYTGGSTQPDTYSHGLKQTPGMILFKKTSGTQDWWVWHRSGGGIGYAGNLNTTGSFFNAGTVVTAVSDTTFSVNYTVNGNGDSYVAYLFAHNDGDGEFGPAGDQDIIKCGSYTGNGSSNGPEIDLGFEPQWIVTKASSISGEDWRIFDVMRGWTHRKNTSSNDNPDKALMANVSSSTGHAQMGYPTSTGFKLDSNDHSHNKNGETYIYIAIRRGPLAPPESATEVFGIDTRTGNQPSYVAPFEPDMAIRRNVTIALNNSIAARLTGTGELTTNDTAAESSDGGFLWDYMDGWANDGSANSNTYSWMWKRAPGYFDVVAYTGNGTAGRTVSHNLGVAPEMIWVKRRDGASSWITYWESLGATKGTFMDTNAPFTSTSYWNDTAPTNSVFSLGNGSTNTSSGTFIAYLFASLPGISKVGSFTGNGGSQTIDCGFTSGARFVLIKRTSATSNWLVFDTERGIVSGNDPYLFLDTSDAQSPYGGFDEIDPHPSDFTFNYNPAGFALNGSGSELIFYAIA